MNKTLYIILLLVAVFTYSCKTQQKSEKVSNDSFTVIKATQEHWHAGVRDGGSGTDYFIKLLVNTNKPISFDSLWVANTRLKVKVVKNGALLINHSEISKGDTITLRSTLLKRDDVKPETILSPITKDDLQVLIQYYLDNKGNYYLTNDLEEVKGPLRP